MDAGGALRFDAQRAYLAQPLDQFGEIAGRGGIGRLS